MKTIREIQDASGDLWPDIDEAFNDIRRDAAASTKATLDDKDASHEETITKMKTDHEAALALEKDVSAAKLKEADGTIATLQASLATVTSERDTLAASLAGLEGRSKMLAEAARAELAATSNDFATFFAQAKAAFDSHMAAFEGFTNAANQTYDEQKAAEEAAAKAKAIADAKALLAKLGAE